MSEQCLHESFRGVLGPEESADGRPWRCLDCGQYLDIGRVEVTYLGRLDA